MSQPLISGFMIVRNVAVQGYPFIEAIRSALPLCDEFLVSDGGSTDETWRALEILRDRYPGRITLFRDPWPPGSNRGGTLAQMTNILRARCGGRYIFNLQANEILHESSVETIRGLVDRWPAAVLFRLPFHNLIGDHILWMTDYRRRLAVNRQDILSLADAYDLGADRSLFQRLQRVLKRESLRTENVWLPEPVYRYRVLFPTDYIRRLEAVTPSSRKWASELDFARKVYARFNPNVDASREFWRQMSEYFDGPILPSGFPRRCAGEIAGAPAIAQPLFGKWSYPLEESLARAV